MSSRSSVQEKGRTSHMGNRLPARRRLLLPGLQRSTYRLALPLAWRSEEHTSELQSLMRIPYAVFCLQQTQQTPAQHSKHITQNTKTTITHNHTLYKHTK